MRRERTQHLLASSRHLPDNVLWNKLGVPQITNLDRGGKGLPKECNSPGKVPILSAI